MRRFGIREICDVKFKCKVDNTTIGSTTFMKDDLVIYFDSAKTSSLEGTATSVYATGGRGAARLLTWEGEKEMTFTFEDALISPLGMSILMGANLITGGNYYRSVLIKATAVDVDGAIQLDINDALVELCGADATLEDGSDNTGAGFGVYLVDGAAQGAKMTGTSVEDNVITAGTDEPFIAGSSYIVDGYVSVKGTTLTVESDKFSDYFYIEADTLFRDETTGGEDVAAQFVIPKGKVASNFNISMANSGDPSTFTFEVACMEDYTKFKTDKKVLCVINTME